MYRAVALAALQSDVPADDHERISQLASELNIELKPGLHGQQLVLLNGEDVSELIRVPEVSRLVPQVAAIGAVRKVLVELQQRMARAKGVVMDGRDIGTHVIPDAEVKIFLTASAEERAKRRYEELTGKGVQVTYEQLVSDINERDRIDRERDISPLVQAADAVFIDSTGLTVQQVVNTIVNICRRALHKGESYG
jgi:cytidylate kinase